MKTENDFNLHSATAVPCEFHGEIFIDNFKIVYQRKDVRAGIFLIKQPITCLSCRRIFFVELGINGKVNVFCLN